MQNKPNFLAPQMSASSALAKDYKNQGRLRTPPKQTQSNPISKAKKCCGICPENFCERKQPQRSIDVNEQG
jgi:hypothetical protein